MEESSYGRDWIATEGRRAQHDAFERGRSCSPHTGLTTHTSDDTNRPSSAGGVNTNVP